jgi:hypothetical protein
VIREGETGSAYIVSVRKPQGKNHLEDPGVDGVFLLEWLLKKSFWRAWAGLIWLRKGTSGKLL